VSDVDGEVAVINSTSVAVVEVKPPRPYKVCLRTQRRILLSLMDVLLLVRLVRRRQREKLASRILFWSSWLNMEQGICL
jgi:hypothetical protein